MSNSASIRELISLRPTLPGPVPQLAIRLAIIAATERARTVWPRHEGPLS